MLRYVHMCTYMHICDHICIYESGLEGLKPPTKGKGQNPPAPEGSVPGFPSLRRVAV